MILYVLFYICYLTFNFIKYYCSYFNFIYRNKVTQTKSKSLESQQNKHPKESAIPEEEFDEKKTWSWTYIFKFLIKVLVVKIATQINLLKFIKFFHQFFFYVKFFFANIFQNILKMVFIFEINIMSVIH